MGVLHQWGAAGVLSRARKVQIGVCALQALVIIPVLRRMLVRGMKAAKNLRALDLRITKALKTPTESAT